MKHKSILILLSILLTFACLFASCNANKKIFSENFDTTVTDDYSITIESLENQIIELQQNQYISEIERQEELKRLNNLLAQLKGEATDSSPLTSDTDASSQPPSALSQGKFLYELADESAVITGYTGNEENLVIPSMIDGHKVTEIADSAFSSSQLKRVIVPSGVTKIGWFSFQNCPSLNAVTLPSSITAIGHSAFPAQSKGFSIYCPNDSFALQYAKSYGIAYTII